MGGKSVIGLCAGFGSIVGGYLPELWGASGFGLTSLLFSVVGGVAGIWLALRIVDVLEMRSTPSVVSAVLSDDPKRNVARRLPTAKESGTQAECERRRRTLLR